MTTTPVPLSVYNQELGPDGPDHLQNFFNRLKLEKPKTTLERTHEALENKKGLEILLAEELSPSRELDLNELAAELAKISGGE